MLAIHNLCCADCDKYGGHYGDVKPYNVSDLEHNYDWGLFVYCDAAVDRDIADGFMVTEVDDE